MRGRCGWLVVADRLATTPAADPSASQSRPPSPRGRVTAMQRGRVYISRTISVLQRRISYRSWHAAIASHRAWKRLTDGGLRTHHRS